MVYSLQPKIREFGIKKILPCHAEHFTAFSINSAKHLVFPAYKEEILRRVVSLCETRCYNFSCLKRFFSPTAAQNDT